MSDVHDRILRKRDLVHKLSLSLATINRLPLIDPKFPKRIQLSPGMVGYSEREINEWLEDRKTNHRCYPEKGAQNV